MFDYMPVQASAWAERVDWINNLITYAAVFCTVAITGVMVAFAIRYRRRSESDETAYITHNAALETVWTFVPTVVVIFIFYYGFALYHEMRNPPSNSLEIVATGKKWSWEFRYPNGKTSGTELVIPINKPVRIVMTSVDVLHSLFIPAMRVKEDVLPGGKYSYLWFTPTKLGNYPIFCTEYCGTNHWNMQATLRVVSLSEYEDYIADRTAVQLTPEEKGKRLFAEKGCVQCHSVDGTKGLGPTLQGLTKHSRKLASGETIEADENYISNSIMNPNAQIVEGFPPIMPPQSVNEQELVDLISYLKTL